MHFSLNPLDDFQSYFRRTHAEPEVPSTPTLKTLLTAPPRKCLHADCKMPSVDPTATKQLKNLPGRQNAIPAHAPH